LSIETKEIVSEFGTEELLQFLKPRVKNLNDQVQQIMRAEGVRSTDPPFLFHFHPLAAEEPSGELEKGKIKGRVKD